MTEPAGGGGLQFERVETDAAPAPGAGLACGSCGRQLYGSYFEVGGMTSCEACRYRIEEAERQGPGPAGFLRALLAGVAAAAISAGLWYAVIRMTGREWGILALVVGLFVGAAVRWGSGRWGGWVYQAMAIALTYLGIVAGYVPLLAQGLGDGPLTAISVVSLTVAVLAMPFLAGLDNIIGILIIGFALYEAWKLNRRLPLTITGPFAIGHGAPAVAAETAGARTPWGA